jgi:hypothetical protein
MVRSGPCPAVYSFDKEFLIAVPDRLKPKLSSFLSEDKHLNGAQSSDIFSRSWNAELVGLNVGD